MDMSYTEGFDAAIEQLRKPSSEAISCATDAALDFEVPLMLQSEDVEKIINAVIDYELANKRPEKS
jgi:hypothetical protein